MGEAIAQPHDGTFKSMMSYPPIAQEFFERHLLAVTDLRILEPCKGSCVSEALKERHMDMLFKTAFHGKTGYLYLLVEHQSTPDKFMPIRLLSYISNFLAEQSSDCNPGELPMIYPMVFYHGQQPYTVSTNLLDFFKDPELAAQFLFRPHGLIDMNKIRDEELKRYVLSGTVELVMKHHFDTEILPTIQDFVEQFVEFSKRVPKTVLNNLGCYIMIMGESAQKEQLVEALTQAIGVESMTSVAEQFRQEGRQEGWHEGLMKGKRDMALFMLGRGVGLDLVAQASGITEQELKTLMQKMVY